MPLQLRPAQLGSAWVVPFWSARSLLRERRYLGLLWIRTEREVAFAVRFRRESSIVIEENGVALLVPHFSGRAHRVAVTREMVGWRFDLSF